MINEKAPALLKSEVTPPGGETKSYEKEVGKVYSNGGLLSQVSVSASRTINTGNYTAMKLGCSCTVPVPTGQEASGFSFAQAQVFAQMTLLLKEVGVE